jgi:hypothetical protein
VTLSDYNKSLTSLYIGVLGWGAMVVASPSAQITAPEWLMLAGVIGGAFGVKQIANTGQTVVQWRDVTPGPPLDPSHPPL